MPRRRHDSLSKDLLTLWLEPLGSVEAPRRVHGEERQLDLLFTARPDRRAPAAYRQHLGLLGRMARGVAALEVFRNACSEYEVLTCVVKRVELYADVRRRARRQRRPAASVPPPHLWALTPSASPALLAAFGARPSGGLPAGFFALPRGFGLTLVAAARLPRTPETLWLRLLGRDRVQQQAFDELGRLPDGHPLRDASVLRVLRWRSEAEREASPSAADRELIMNSERLVQQWEQRLRREGKAEGKVEGKAEGLRAAVLDLCEVLGIEVGPRRRAQLEAMGLGELEALRAHLKQARRWPSPGRAAPRS
ncbi:MAG TPA: hypothetical protein VFS43_28225 [Polyangiaceae bacterium]|nr:hypothetical protein [Polyangiaceae bacterium]